MATCVAKSEGKLIDARFLRPLSERERSKMEDHLGACGWCRERYRKLQLAGRVIAFGADGELDQPAPPEVERIAQDLGLLDAPRAPRPWFGMPFFGAAASIAAVALMAVLFLRPSDELVERGAASGRMTFSAYAIAEGSEPRLLEAGARVAPSEHLKLRAAWGSGAREIGGVDVLLVAADGVIEHVRLPAPETAAEVASVPGAVGLAGLSPGPLTAYVVAAKRFELTAEVKELAKRRAPPGELAKAVKDASVERIDLVVEGR